MMFIVSHLSRYTTWCITVNLSIKAGASDVYCVPFEQIFTVCIYNPG